MAYEKLTVVYDYRDGPDDGSDDEEDTHMLNGDQNSNSRNGTKPIPAAGDTRTHYGKLSTQSPKKTATNVTTKTCSPHSPEVERKTVGDRVLGALSTMSDGFSNWFVLSASNAATMDTYMYGNDARRTMDQLDHSLSKNKLKHNTHMQKHK